MANRIVTAAVTGESIKLSEKSAGAAGSFNAVSLSFTFDSKWDGTTKIVQFLDAYGANPTNIPLTIDLLVSGAYIVPIPAEPLAYAGEMTVTVRGVDFATDGTTAERIIIAASTTMKVLSSLYEVGGATPVEPTPTQTELLQAEIDSIITDLAAIPAAVTAAQGSATSASNSATAADASADAALVSQTAAESAKTSAESTVSAFDTHAASIKTDFDNNATAKTTEFNDNATAANATIDGKVTTATNAATAAQSAQSSAETARDSAISAKTDAQTARTGAQTAQTASELAETNAGTAATNAGTYATNAQNSATAAAGSATDANSAKVAAQTAQTAAELAETHAETAETNAETAETNATAKAVLAESYAKGGTGTRSGEDTDNAMYYKNQAAEIVGGDYPTKTEAQGYVSTHNSASDAHSTLFGAKADKNKMFYPDNVYGGIVSSDINAITVSGFYTATTASTGIPNTSSNWYIQHINSNSGTASAFQTAKAYDSVGLYYRSKVAGVWGAWAYVPASQVGVADAGNYFTGITVEAVLQEIGNTLPGLATTYAAASHTHGNVTNDGKIGSTADSVVVTGTAGALTTKTVADTKTLLGITDSNYVKLLSTTVGTSAASISLDLSGLNTGDYSEICVEANIYTDAASTVNCTLNNLTSGYYGSIIPSGATAVSAISNAASFGDFQTLATSESAAWPCDITLNIVASQPYAGTASQNRRYAKTMFFGNSSASSNRGRWGNASIALNTNSAAANILSSVQFVASTGNIMANSKFWVYGVKK